MKKLLYILIIPIIVLVTQSCSSDHEHHEVVTLEPVLVTVQTLAPSDYKSTFSVSGNIQPDKEANISTRMMGYIDNIYAEVGNRVSKGKVLISISNNELQAKLAQVKANIIKAEVGLENARKDYDRYTTLFSQKSITQKELDDITAHYNMSKAGLEAAQQMKKEVEAEFAYTRITAPFSGTITAKYVNSGDMANPGMPLLSLASTNNFQAVAMVPENKISKLEKGQKVFVYVKSLQEEIVGTIDEIAVSSTHTGGQYIVKIDLELIEKPLYSGMFTTVSFTQENNAENNSIFIPESSLITKGSLKGVYTVGSNNTAILRWLRIGKKVGDQYEVLSGLSNGEKVVLSAQSRLFNGAPLKY